MADKIIRPERCAWCSGHPRRIRKPIKFAKGLDGWKGICRVCYDKRKENPLMEFKELTNG